MPTAWHSVSARGGDGMSTLAHVAVWCIWRIEHGDDLMRIACHYASGDMTNASYSGRDSMALSRWHASPHAPRRLHSKAGIGRIGGKSDGWLTDCGDNRETGIKRHGAMTSYVKRHRSFLRIAFHFALNKNIVFGVSTNNRNSYKRGS